MKTWIHEDQAGFLPNRQMKDNMRNIINIIEYYDKRNEKEIALLFVDAEKAFDRLNWDFIKKLQKELDMGVKFGNAIEAIYKNQKAKIGINGQLSENWVKLKRE